jgi:hypothetical protein
LHCDGAVGVKLCTRGMSSRKLMPAVLLCCAVLKPKLDKDYHKLLGAAALVIAKPLQSEIVAADSTASTAPYEVKVPPNEQYVVLYDPHSKRPFFFNRVTKTSSFRRPKAMRVAFGESAASSAIMPEGGALALMNLFIVCSTGFGGWKRC